LSVFKVASSSNCPTPKNLKALTLPPTSGPAFFCAANGSGVLTYTTSPTLCTSGQFAVEVVVPAPVLANIESSTLQYYAGTPAVAITSSLTASSAQTTNLVGATVTISAGFVSSDDSLGFTNQNGITGSYNASTGVLTLTGTASVANYQSALRSVTYRDSNALTSTATRTISFQVNDGLSSNNLSNVASRTINVMTNAAPTAGNVSASTDKHTAIDINVLSSASDVDGDTVSTASVDTTGTLGTVSINANGTIHYDPNGQFQNLLQGQTATDTFTYKVSDGFQASSSATVTVTINGANDPPVLANIETGTLQYTAGTPGVAVTSSLTVSSPDTTTLAGATMSIGTGFTASEDSLAFTNQNGITGSYNSTTGVLTLSGTGSVANYQTALRSVTFSDSNGSSPTTGPRTISFQVDDGLSSSNLSNVVSRMVNVNPNAPPSAGPVSASTDKHTATDINVLASASDPDGDTLSVTAVDTTGTKGSVSINSNGTVHYDPNGQFTGLTAGQTATDTFTYTVSDGVTTATGTVTVTITGVNDPPIVANIETAALSYRAQDPAVAITSTLTLSDDDDSTFGGATVSITSGFSSANDTLNFTNQNGITGSYNATTGVLTLTGNASLANYEAALRSVEFFTSDSSTSPAARTVSFSVTDSVGASSTTPAQRTINVSEANQPPVAIDHSYTAVGNTPLGVGTTPTGPAATQSGSLLNGDSDPDSGGSISVTGNSAPTHGSVAVNADGTFTYTPNAGFSGTDTFTYTITDSDDPLNPKSDTATVTITVGPVVWYVDNSKVPAGNGEASTPFNTLAAANSAAGANSIIFLYQGNATYTGGVGMKSGEDLFGQPHGLTVDSYSLVAAGGSVPTITNSGGDGIDLGEGSDVEAVNVSSPSGNGVAASGVNAATVGASNAVAISGAGGDGIHISGGSGALNFAGASVTGSTGHSVSVASRTGGTASVGGNITDHGTGISLSGNGGVTITFGGTLSLSTGANTAFSATGGGTVAATGTGSTVATTTATAVNVSSTTIGSSGLNFQSISSNGANPGISLSSTGSSGGLTVTGTGTAGSGGTVQNAGTTGDGINLSSTSSPSFTDMVIQNNGAGGINGSQVNGLTLAGSTVSGNGTAANISGANNDGLDFSPAGTSPPNGLTGTVSITNSTITGSANNNAVITDSSGALSLTVTGTAISNTSTVGNAGLLVNANGTTSATVSITNSTFTNSRGSHFHFVTDDLATGTNSVTFSNNTLNTTSSYTTGSPPHQASLGGGAFIDPGGTGSTTVTVDNNTITNVIDNAISVGADDNATLTGTIHGNTVGTATTTATGSGSQGNDIKAFSEGTVTSTGGATVTLAITNNNLYHYASFAAIDYIDREAVSAALNLTITGNTLAFPDGNATNGGAWGILGEGGGATTDNGIVCAAISGNSLTGSGQASLGSNDIELDQVGSITYRLPGYTGTQYNTGAVQTFVAGNNNSGGTPNVLATTLNTGPGFVGGTSCPAP
jgi:VCBS repeat-containing protein